LEAVTWPGTSELRIGAVGFYTPSAILSHPFFKVVQECYGPISILPTWK
jgi:hypothetical protein